MARRPKKLPESRLPDLVLRDFRRLRRQREEREEVAASNRIRPEAALQVAEGTLVVEQGNDDAFRRGMLTLPQPRVPAARRRPDRRRMPPEDLDSLRLLALAEPEAGEPQEHGRSSRLGPKELVGTGKFMVARRLGRAMFSRKNIGGEPQKCEKCGSEKIFFVQHSHGNYPILDYVCPKCDLGGDEGVPDWYVHPTGEDDAPEK